jgi:hypothetical protein
MQIVRCQCSEWLLQRVCAVPIVVFDNRPGPILTGKSVDRVEYRAASAGPDSMPLTRCPSCRQTLDMKTPGKEPLCC